MKPRTPLLLSGLAGVATAVARRHRTIRRVARDLRGPSLWVPLAVDNTVALRLARRFYGVPTDPVRGVTTSRREVPGGQDVFIHEPDGVERPRAALLWIHGGGTVLGAPEQDHDLCSRIARDTGVTVLAVRYRLAPEHPFPAGFDDCFAALQWLYDEATSLGVDATRIAVGGASAGGGLAAAVAQRAYDEDVPLAFQLLAYPMLDDRTVLRRDHGGRGRIIWTPRSNRYAWTRYLDHPPRAGEPRAYAVPARRADLTGLPPAWIGVGDLDLFHDEDLAYARRLEEAGVPVDVFVEPGMYHAADVERATVPSMQAFRQAMFDALGAGLGAPTP